MSTRRVLLVDPDPADRELLALVLEATSAYRAVAVDDAIGLAEALADGDFDALVFEQWLDWTDAPRLLAAVARRHPGCALVLFTAAPDPDSIHAALGHGLDGVVIKSSAGYRRVPEVLDEIFARRDRPASAAGAESSVSSRGPGRSRDRASGRAPDEERGGEPSGDTAPPATPGAVEELARVVAHDVKAPLQQIERYSSLLADRFGSQLGPRGGQYVHHLVEASRRLQEMIDEIVDYSQAGAARTFRQVDLGEVLEEVLENLSPAIEASGGRVLHESLPSVPGDRAGLVRLLQNLIDNALKFRGDDPPEVRVAAARGADGWELSVSDNGIGIDEKDHERIFSMFGRLHTAEEYPGSGVGLAVCRRIAERHGGRITIDSEPGRGTTFTVRLPATAVEEAS